MAKRKAPAAVGQRQMFPESLQDQRQLTMGSLLPIAEQRRIAASTAAQSQRAWNALLPQLDVEKWKPCPGCGYHKPGTHSTECTRRR